MPEFRSIIISLSKCSSLIGAVVIALSAAACSGGTTPRLTVSGQSIAGQQPLQTRATTGASSRASSSYCNEGTSGQITASLQDGTKCWYLLVNNESPYLCLDGNLPKAGLNGSPVQLWQCGFPAPLIQQWAFIPVGGGFYTIVNREDRKCLDGHLESLQTPNGDKTQLWECNHNPVQNWAVEPGNVYDTSSIWNEWEYSQNRTYKCLDGDNGPNGDTFNGDKVQLWDCHGLGHLGTPIQQWSAEWIATTPG